MAQTVQLGNLAVNITGSSAEFVRSARAARKQTNQFKRDVRNMRRGLRSLQRDVRGAVRFFRNFGLAIAGVGAAVVGVVKKTADWGAELLENSRLVGLTVEQYQGLRRLFQGDGLGAAQAQRAIQRLNDVIDDARQGKGEGLDVFQRLGIDPNSIQNTYEGILRISDALSRLSDQDRLALGVDLFGGRGSRAILPLTGGSARVEEQVGYFNRLLTTLNEQQLQQLKDLGQAFVNLADQIGATTADVISEYADELRVHVERATRGFPEFLDKVQLTFQVIRENLEPIVDSIIGVGATYGIVKGAKFLQSVFGVIGAGLASLRGGLGGGSIGAGIAQSIRNAPPGAVGATAVGVAAGSYVLSNVWDAFFGIRESLGRDREAGRENIVRQFREQMGRIEDRELLESIQAGLRAAISGSLDEALGILTPLGYGSLSIRTSSNLRLMLDELNDRIARLGDTAEKTANQTNNAAMALAAVRAAAGEPDFTLGAVSGQGQQIFSGVLPALRLSASQIVRGMFARAAGFGLDAGGGTGLFRGGGIGLDIGGDGHRLLRGLFGGATTFEGIERVDERLRQLQETAREVGRVFGSAFDSAFRDLFQGFDNFGERMKRLFRELASDLVSILLSPLRQHIQNFVAGLAFNSGIFT